MFDDGRALLAGKDDAKFHSSSSAGAGAVCGGCVGAGPPTRSRSDEAGWVCGGWKGLDDALGLADTSDANGSAGGGVAVDWACGDAPMTGVGD